MPCEVAFSNIHCLNEWEHEMKRDEPNSIQQHQYARVGRHNKCCAIICALVPYHKIEVLDDKHCLDWPTFTWDPKHDVSIC